MRARRMPTPFGHAVRIRLAQLNLQQRDLARMLGTSEAFVTYLIYGDRREEGWIIRVCQALEMETADFLTDGEAEQEADDRRMVRVEIAEEI